MTCLLPGTRRQPHKSLVMRHPVIYRRGRGLRAPLQPHFTKFLIYLVIQKGMHSLKRLDLV